MKKEVQEIDLLDLFLKTFVFIKKNIVSFLMFGAIGAMLGATYSFIRPEKFSIEIVGFSTVIDTEVIKETICEMASPEYKKNLSKKTNNEKFIRNISAISGIDISELQNSKKKILKLTFYSSQPFESETLQDIIGYNLSENHYISTIIENQKNKIKGIIIFLEKEIKLKQEALAVASDTKATILVNTNETPASLFIMKKEYEEELSFLSPFVVSKIGEPKVANSASLPFLLAFGGFLGCFLVVFFHAIKAINKLSKALPEKTSAPFVYEKSA